MKDYLNEINDKFPIRRNKKQKEEFFNYVKNECENAYIDEINKNKNIVIGDIKKAKVVIAAHYDTPATSILPNMMLPKNFIICLLYQFVLVGIILGVTFLLRYLLNFIPIFSKDYKIVQPWLLLFIYFLIFYLFIFAFTNKHNKNDNTSGVATVLTLAKKINRSDICYVLFDNEENGLLGSKALNKKYKAYLEDILVLNFDCVGNGKYMLAAVNKNTNNNELFQKLKCITSNNENFTLEYFSATFSLAASDHKSFKNGVGFMACHKSKVFGYYAGRIHTNKDTVADTKNIDFLVNYVEEFLQNI